MDKALTIDLIIAEFSYAELPTYFKHIIGVTGTLTAIPRVKREILEQKYNIKDNYIIPSSFGINDKKKKHQYIEVKMVEHKAKIISRIMEIYKK